MTRTREQIAEEQDRLAKELADIRASDIAAWRDTTKRLAAEHGMSVDAFFSEHGRMPQKRTTNAPMSAADGKTPKYRDPETGRTWVGSGQPPKWFTEHVQSGTPKESLLIGNQQNGHAHA